MSYSKSSKTLLSFYKLKGDNPLSSKDETSSNSSDQRPSKVQRTVPDTDSDKDFFTRDPGKRRQIWKEPVNNKDEIRRKYLRLGPFQPLLDMYPPTKDGKQLRRFQSSWFKKYPWIEYSIECDMVFCLYCFLFETNPPTRASFTVEGFQSWKRVGGVNCAFLQHVGGSGSSHLCAMKAADDLMNPSLHIRRALDAQSKEIVERNQLRLKTSIECARWLALQSCSFRGNDESFESRNRGNFIEMIKHSAKCNEEISKVVLENAPGNAKYTSSTIQKEILTILGDKIRNKIREEIGDGNFCILVDEAQDTSTKEQMAIVLRFVNNGGLVQERFFGIVSVEDTTSLTLKNEISKVLSLYNLEINKIRGQGYDGASNMRGAWNGLQALFLKECSYAYYVHCFAHQLQLTLVSASKDVQDIWLFFSKLSIIVNLVNASPKRHSELQSSQLAEIENKIALGELDTGRGANQLKTLQRAGATRWSSHLSSVSSLIDLFSPSCDIINNIWQSQDMKPNKRAEAKGAYLAMTSFDFVFILHLLNEILSITDVLCKSLQLKSQDIVNAMNLVTTTKKLLQNLRDNSWLAFFKKVERFCEKCFIDIPNMNMPYKVGTSRSCQQHDDITILHHYHIDIFNAAIDFQIVELNTRFSEGAMELLILSTALDPRDAYKSFKIDNICTLAEKYYPQDFTLQEIHSLKYQLQHYELDIPSHPSFQNLSTISELCKQLFETRKRDIYYLVDRLVRLILTLPVSTATTERAFSAMKIVKTTLRNKMGDDFLEDCMIINIERELAEEIDVDSVVSDFNSRKERRVQLV